MGPGNNSGSNSRLLLSEYAFGEEVPFNLSGANTWQGSDVQNWCGNFYADALSAVEQTALVKTTKSDGEYTSKHNYVFGTSALSDEYVFLLSAEEAETYFPNNASRKGKIPDGEKIYYFSWWLRSPLKGSDTEAGVVSSIYGRVTYSRADEYIDEVPMRPAFNLNLPSVLFTSIAEGGKPTAAGLAEIQSGVWNDWKLTLLDASRNGFTATAGTGAVLKKPADYATWSVPVTYSGATTGENEKISALLCKDGKALYYGPLADAASGEQSVEVSIPAGLAEGEYLLRVFNEQVNGDGMTDYASPFRDITIKVLAAGTPPKLTSLSVDPIRCAVGTEVKLEVWTCEPEGADFTDEKYYMRDRAPPMQHGAWRPIHRNILALAAVTVKVFDLG